jgi:diguanylate cyclase (GGDEF)-like protein
MELVYVRRSQGPQPRESEAQSRTTKGESERAPTGRGIVARLVAPFALLVLSATFFCAVVISVVAHQADERNESERRAALQRAIDDIRSTGSPTLDPGRIRALEQTWGLKDLRFETDPALDGREVQSVIDGNGRIVGWFSWQPDRPLTQALLRLGPLVAAIGLALVAFAGVAIWLVRRSTRELAASEQRAWKLANEDPLTGLPNRRKILELADEALRRRKSNEVVTFAFLGLEGFKDVNDTLGHLGGDQLLGEVATRLREAFPQSAVGRFGGAEFAIVMKGLDRDAAILVAEHAVAEVAKPYSIDQMVQIGAGVGLAVAPRDGRDRDELTRRADLALRAARRHSGLVVAFEPVIETEFNERRFLERELHRALTAQALDVHYQPIVTADGTRIVGVEALARWTDASRGVIPPSVFVPVAEQTGLMGELGEFVLRRALADAVHWPELSIAVNLSPMQVRDRGLLSLVSSLLQDAQIAPERLVLEVTEGVLIDDPDDAKAQLGALRALGVQIALDDFGTGYSSLSYLRQFPIDKLKIDRSFVEPLGRSPESRVMVQAMVGLGRALGHTVVAEGVESELQRVLLRMAGCSEMQGHLFARPGPREAIARLVEKMRQPQMMAATA